MHSKEERWCPECTQNVGDNVSTNSCCLLVVHVKPTSNPFVPLVGSWAYSVHLCTTCQLRAGSCCTRVPQQWSEGVSSQHTFQILSPPWAWTECSISQPTPPRIELPLPASRSLWSYCQGRLHVLQSPLTLKAERTTTVAGPQLWNQLPRQKCPLNLLPFYSGRPTFNCLTLLRL